VVYDEKLAARIRELLARERGVKEQRMFGGLAFLVGGNMAIAASGGGGGALVRCDPTNRMISAQGRRRLSSRCAAGRCRAGCG
jgi:hypothetical protein